MLKDVVVVVDVERDALVPGGVPQLQRPEPVRVALVQKLLLKEVDVAELMHVSARITGDRGETSFGW